MKTDWKYVRIDIPLAMLYEWHSYDYCNVVYVGSVVMTCYCLTLFVRMIGGSCMGGVATFHAVCTSMVFVMIVTNFIWQWIMAIEIDFVCLTYDSWTTIFCMCYLFTIGVWMVGLCAPINLNPCVFTQLTCACKNYPIHQTKLCSRLFTHWKIILFLYHNFAYSCFSNCLWGLK